MALTIPDTFDRFTLAAWVKIDRLESRRNALLTSDGWGPGAFHWQTYRQGPLTASGVYGWQRVTKGAGEPVPLGRWGHLATVFDRSAGECRHFIDGAPAGRVRFALDAPVAPGASRIGRWLPGAGFEPEVRDFRGRVDELAMWRRALNDDELRRLAEEGRPGPDLGGLAPTTAGQRAVRRVVNRKPFASWKDGKMVCSPALVSTSFALVLLVSVPGAFAGEGDRFLSHPPLRPLPVPAKRLLSPGCQATFIFPDVLPHQKMLPSMQFPCHSP